MKKIKILFVCMGNICRSPLAHAVFLDLIKKVGAENDFEVESCGTGNWHAGELPDERMRAEAKKHNIIMDHPARPWEEAYEEYFDIILAMDRINLEELLSLSKPEFHEKIKLFRSYDPEATESNDEVPDPYYGGADFVVVYDIVERTCKNLLSVQLDLLL